MDFKCKFFKIYLRKILKVKGIVNKDKGIMYASSVRVRWLNRPLLTHNAHPSPVANICPNFFPVSFYLRNYFEGEGRCHQR